MALSQGCTQLAARRAPDRLGSGCQGQGSHHRRCAIPPSPRPLPAPLQNAPLRCFATLMMPWAFTHIQAPPHARLTAQLAPPRRQLCRLGRPLLLIRLLARRHPQEGGPVEFDPLGRRHRRRAGRTRRLARRDSLGGGGRRAARDDRGPQHLLDQDDVGARSVALRATILAAADPGAAAAATGGGARCHGAAVERRASGGLGAADGGRVRSTRWALGAAIERGRARRGGATS